MSRRGLPRGPALPSGELALGPGWLRPSCPPAP